MKNIKFKTPMLVCEYIGEKDIKSAQYNYIEHIFINFAESISLDSLIEQNIYKLDEMLLDKDKKIKYHGIL